ncbi:P-loop containing nucleoside triphosphate hydrolase protein [Favolaschia claudopus]|uniref:P-loop containing nucleoside triphosphate hydrolase protein n=1 Tax=Favolaschia claudopus TaxID=2862362 RepID=A0AAW0C7Q0_9AGAR
MSTINHAPPGTLQWPIDDPNFTTVDANSLQILERFKLCFLGAHSVGKSTVVENLIGREFLPHGFGNVTRRPLIVQLIHRPVANRTSTNNASTTTDATANSTEWGEFLHLPNQKFFDYTKIRDQILYDTEAETQHLSDSREISPNPIHLRIFSPKVLTLTLIDLPGIPVKHPIYEQPIRDMLIQYISSPACLIIAVISALDDLAHCKALKMAREVDPGRARTFGLLTKVDLMDPGYDVVRILAGRIISLPFGYVPLVNRGIGKEMDIASALKAEREFFKRHPSYQAKAEYCGMPFFAHKLNLWLKLRVQV